VDYDVVIIGAGLSGLAAGIRLAHYGKKVVIFERHTLIGGLNSWYRRHGREFDVGLHAMTNFALASEKTAPLNKMLRQLRIRYADLHLEPQSYSLIRFPSQELRFANRLDELEQSVARTFPGQLAGFRALVRRVEAIPPYSLQEHPFPARTILGEHISDPLLIDMLLCPLMYYGSAVQGDMEFSQFCIMFRSIFLEGLARPAGGIRVLLDLLLARYLQSGGELRLRCGVRKLLLRDGQVREVELQDGARFEAGAVLSSAGYIETLRLCDPLPPETQTHPAGELAFVETIFLLDRPPAAFGFTPCNLFFNDSERFHFARPTRLVDARSGVVNAPDNFVAEADGAVARGDSVLRLTQLGDHEPWRNMRADTYQASKDRLLEEQLTILDRLLPGIRNHVVCTGMFTPRSVLRFTGHIHGAVYGSPQKLRDGTTRIGGLFICGTDQGFLGIVGALLSGITMANRHFLARPSRNETL